MNDITVIVPCYNKENYIGSCIESILKQSYKKIDIIIVDDCSTDRSFDIAKMFEKENINVHVYKNIKNSGVSATRNNGVKNAQTTFITFLDADDFYFNPQKIENEMSVCQSNSDNVVSLSNIVKVSTNGDKIIKKYKYPLKIRGFMLRFCNISLWRPIYCRDYVVSKKVFENIGGYKIGCNLFEDLDLLYRLSYVCDFYNTSKFGTAYRCVDNGLSKQTEKRLFEAESNITATYVNRYNTLNRYLFMLLRTIIVGIRKLYHFCIYRH